MSSSGLASPRRFANAVVAIALLGAVIGGVGAPLITSVAHGFEVPLDAAQWTLTITLCTGAVSAPVLGRLGAGARRRAALLVTLALVAVGGLLTCVPLGFGGVLAGRALQGLGLGVVPLLVSMAREYLAAEAAQRTIATVSVASTLGVGIAYPLVGFIDQVAGLRAAYAAGFVLSLAAFCIACVALPKEQPHAAAVGIDLRGALLLGIATFGLLLAVAQPSMWTPPWLGASLVLLVLVCYAVWVWVERRGAAPLVDLRLFVQGGVLRANAAMLLSGIGMYLLFSVLTRYVQTPVSLAYGFGLPGVLAGATLIPFALMGFVAGQLSPWLLHQLGARWTFAIYSTCVILAALLSAAWLLQSFLAMLTAMAALGAGVGGISAIMPSLILDGVPQSETASVVSMNQIVRSIGFSIGSAVAGLLLALAMAQDAPAPEPVGYVVAALSVVPLLLLAMLLPAKARGRAAASA